MSTELELETSCGLSFKAWKDQAAKAGLVLRASQDPTDSGDYPEHIYSSLRNFRRIISKAKGEPRKVVTHMHRQLVSTRDEKRKIVKKEYLTWTGYYEVFDHRGVPYRANLDVGRYEQPKIVANESRRFNPKTGEAIGPEKTFAGRETIYTIEVPKSKTDRKKLVDEIIGDNIPEDIQYYYDNEDEPLGRSDSTFDYENFILCTIEELRDLSFKGGGNKTPGFYRDNEGKLRDKFGQLVSNAKTGQGGYQ
jgi:hypothetical protein